GEERHDDISCSQVILGADSCQRVTGEVAYCPDFPLGECAQSLEKMRVELLSDCKKRNNRETVRAKMKTRSHCDVPMTSDVQEKWPALFDVMEDMTEANTLREVEGTTVGIYVARETPSNDYSDVGVILEGVVVLHDLENVALAAAMLFGLM
ncbi:hypothetical protein F7725_013558, partial [Dissostichus mawsoni]